jgi:hypothetical protein
MIDFTGKIGGARTVLSTPPRPSPHHAIGGRDGMAIDQSTQSVPFGFCQCGCGRLTKIAEATVPRFGWVRGQPRRFVHGHNGVRNRNSYPSRSLGDGATKRTHILVAERALGRALPKGVEVHHVDENKLNDAPSNLVICQDRDYHVLLHERAKVVRAGGNPNTDGFCTVCRLAKPFSEFGRRIARASGRYHCCKECARLECRERRLRKARGGDSNHAPRSEERQ